MEKAIVKNAHYLSLDPGDLERLEHLALQHRRFSSLEFKVIECSPARLVVRVAQGKSHAANYFDVGRLVEIVRELFQPFGSWDRIEARPIPYAPPVTDVVTAEWVQDQMQGRGLKVKDVARDLGVDASKVSAYKSGIRPMSGVVRAMFFYYFQALGSVNSGPASNPLAKFVGMAKDWPWKEEGDPNK